MADATDEIIYYVLDMLSKKKSTDYIDKGLWKSHKEYYINTPDRGTRIKMISRVRTGELVLKQKQSVTTSLRCEHCGQKLGLEDKLRELVAT